MYGDGLYTRDWLYVKDHARAIDIIFHQGKKQTLIILADLMNGPILIWLN